MSRGTTDERSDDELLSWSREHAQASVERFVAAEALASGVALRTSGLLAERQECLRVAPEDVAAERIEAAERSLRGWRA